MVIDGYGNQVELGDDVVIRCRVLSMRAGEDPLLRLEIYGTFSHQTVNKSRDASGTQHVLIQASACTVVQVPVKSVRKAKVKK